MQWSISKFAAIGVLSCVLAIVTIMGNALRTDSDPSLDGPRALIAEFFGLWIAFASLACSFLVEDPTLQWGLRGVAAGAAVIAFVLSAYFASHSEVPLNADQEPTGFADPTIGLHLAQEGANEALETEASGKRAAFME